MSGERQSIFPIVFEYEMEIVVGGAVIGRQRVRASADEDGRVTTEMLPRPPRFQGDKP